ncbi:MAG: MATE family efflux transporter [Clostridiales bacterium]|nr:MATE family efflux transporter [Clostridiales bacterium]
MSQANTSKNKNSSGIDMTTGNPTRLILYFALPLLAGNILQQLYNMVDSMIVGNFAAKGTEALAAVGTAFPVIFMITSLFNGVAQGATIVISQYYGANNMNGVKRAVDTIYIFLFVVSIPITIIGVLVSRPMLILMKTPPGILPMAVVYMQIIFLGTIASFGYNINSGILQGLGDSKRPLLFLAISAVINIVLDLVFVIGFHWDVAGVAWATIIAQLFSFLFGTYYINRKGGQFKISIKDLEFDGEILKESIRIGLPTGIQNLLFSVAMMALQGLINSYGPAFMAGFNGATKIDAFAFLPLVSFSAAITTYVGQNVGAGRMDRVNRGVRTTLLISTTISIATWIIIMPLGEMFMKLFSQEPEVIQAGIEFLKRVLPFYSILGASFILNGALRGAGESFVPMIGSLVAMWLARVPTAYALAHFFGGHNLYFSYPIGWLIGLIIAGTYYLKGPWKEKAISRAKRQRAA